MKISKYLRFAAVLAPIALMSVTACSDSTGPAGGERISRQERAKLTQILSNPEVMSALVGSSSGMGGYGVILATSVQAIGTITVGTPTALPNRLPGGIRAAEGVGDGASGTYKAFASQIDIKFYPEGSNSVAERFQWNGVIAVDNLNNPTRIISAGAANMNLEAPAMPAEVSLTPSEAAWFGSAAYIRLTGSTVDAAYYSTSGSFSFANATASGSTSCTGGIPVEGVRSCTYGYGSADVAFNFTAKHTSSSATVTVPAVTATVPNVKLSAAFEHLVR